MRFFLYASLEVVFTGAKAAVAARFQQLCAKQNITINELAARSGVTASSFYGMMDPKCRNVSIVLIKKLCDGLNLTQGKFFCNSVFDNLKQKIQ